MLAQFFIVFRDYLILVLPYLALGLLLSGLIHEFVPTGWIEKHLGRKGIKPLLYATLAGAAIPVCCWGSLPVALTLHQKGARLGPVFAILVATPATSITAVLVTYGLLGTKFTIYIFFAVIVMGLIMGLIGNLITVKPKIFASQNDQVAACPVCGMNVVIEGSPKTEYGGKAYYFCCVHCLEAFEASPEEYLATYLENMALRLGHALKYGFVDMMKEIGLELFLGLVLAALVAAIVPVGEFVGNYFGGGLGYLFSIPFGLVMYICSTASVPLIHALITQGMNIGAAMVLLLVGPITTWATILVLRKEFGGKILAIFLVAISALSLILGWSFSLI